MAIGVDRSGNYGGTLVNQKYKPFGNINQHDADGPIYNGMLENRWRMLNASGLLPQPLRLAVPNWGLMLASEVDKNPPLVVVSTNRSSWIKKGIDACEERRKEIPHGRFENPSDLRALTWENVVEPSPPIYCPSRLGNAGARNIYMVVHMAEYSQYKRVLARTGITVVGWEFRLPMVNRAPRRAWVSGFGASRYAAIEFCKHLRSSAPTVGGQPPWDYAWLMDDNVIALPQFAGYRAVEAALRANADLICAGFSGCSGLETRTAMRTWATGQIDGGWGRQAAALPPSVTPGVLQQTVLWNIRLLTNEHLNFGPAYLASAEDVSLGKYFERQETPYLYYASITVQKEQPTDDGGVASAKIRAAREILTTWITDAESVTPPTAPPPPIEVQPTRTGDGGVQTLSNFVVQRVLPNSQKRDSAGDVNVQNIAKSQAVEQLTCNAIPLWTDPPETSPPTPSEPYIADATLDHTFKINGVNAQVIDRVTKR